jgi:hypothetical protein
MDTIYIWFASTASPAFSDAPDVVSIKAGELPAADAEPTRSRSSVPTPHWMVWFSLSVTREKVSAVPPDEPPDCASMSALKPLILASSSAESVASTESRFVLTSSRICGLSLFVDS